MDRKPYLPDASSLSGQLRQLQILMGQHACSGMTVNGPVAREWEKMFANMRAAALALESGQPVPAGLGGDPIRQPLAHRRPR